MGRKRQDREPASDLPPICQRIDWLLRQVWGNVITEMARDLGVSVTVVSRVLAGQQPSGQMLAGFAQRGVNLRWLLTGQGQEMVESGGGASGTLLPVVTRLLPGKPADHPELVGHFTLPAASPYLLEAAYWLKVTSEMPVVSSATLRIATRDYLLIESAERWTRRPEAYRGRLIVVRLPEGKGVILAMCDRDEVEVEETRQHDLKTFGRLAEARLFPRITRADELANPPESTTGRQGVVRFYGDDVVGVVLQRVTFFEA